MMKRKGSSCICVKVKKILLGHSSILMLFYYLAPLQSDCLVMSRCMQFTFGDKVRENIMVNRLSIINHQIPFDWLNLKYTTYKIKCKEKYQK